jgi:hypothetical protein
MAVTIDEMHVEVQQPTASANPSTSSTEKPQKNLDLRAALEMIQERKLRLRAD